MLHFLIATTYLAILTQAAPQTFGVPVLDGKIVGGEPTFIEEFPYQASMLYSSSHRCGAVVVNEEYVVTAAHCTYRIPEWYLSVRAGSSFINSGGVVVNVERIFIHPRYNYSVDDYDISILQLASPLRLGTTIASASLPELDQTVNAGEIAQITGWGTLTEGGSVATQLQVVEVPVVSQEECQAAYGIDSISDRMLCAGIPEGGKDACQGDSGGPLVVNGTLFGLVSWGEGCARPNYPGVYANVPALRDFIALITGL